MNRNETKDLSDVAQAIYDSFHTLYHTFTDKGVPETVVLTTLICVAKNHGVSRAIVDAFLNAPDNSYVIISDRGDVNEREEVEATEEIFTCNAKAD